MTSIKTFKVSSVNLQRLTISEKQLLPLLIEAARIIDKIYCLQENHISNGANFYPRDAIKAEISAAAQKNSKIFSPFSIVKRDKNKKLIAVDYHIEYKPQLEKISKLLNKAAKISSNKSFKTYLNTLAEVLLNGKYSLADKAWLATRGNNLDIVIGPHERYIDKLFFIKRAYQADVSIIDRENSQKAMILRDILYTSVGPNVHRVIPPNSTDVLVKDSFIISGFLGRAVFTYQHLPAETDSVERYGSRILGYQSVLNYKFEKLLYPIFLATFEKHFRSRYTKDIIRDGAFYHVLLNGIIQHLHRYRGSRTRLKDLFPIFDEANTAASSIQHAKHLVLKGVISQKELEAIMIAKICWMFAELVTYNKTNAREVYLKGDAIIFNFLKREGALLEKDGIFWPNFAKMFFEMENLATIFTKTLEDGDYLDAEKFLNKYLTLEPLKAYQAKLLDINAV